MKFSLDRASNVVISLEGEGLSRSLRGPGGTLVTWPYAPAVLSPGTYYVVVGPGYNVDVVPAYTLALEAIAYEPPPTGNMKDGCSADGHGGGVGGAACWIAGLALAFFLAVRRRSRALRA